jgi:hypothetical protein
MVGDVAAGVFWGVEFPSLREVKGGSTEYEVPKIDKIP